MARFASDEDAMLYALALARRGIGTVEPNPPVGAVVLTPSRRWLGEGWHQRCGESHAEVHAILSAGHECRGNDLFVTLEPCSHFGRTPPCVDAVIEAGFRRVVVGCTDPAAHAAGRGLKRLEAAGIEVRRDVCRADAEQLIAPFRTLQTDKRPWIHAKWAMTLDGRIATRTGESQWISNETSRQYVHRLRGRMDAILTAAGSVRTDNPLLTARPPGPRTALRCVLDRTGESLTPDRRLVQTAADAPVLVFVTSDCRTARESQLRTHGLEVVRVAAAASGQPDIHDVLRHLGQRHVTHALLEAGPGLLGSFFDAERIDEVHAFLGSSLAGGSTAPGPIGGTGQAVLAGLPRLQNPTIRILNGNVLVEGAVAATNGHGPDSPASESPAPRPGHPA